MLLNPGLFIPILWVVLVTANLSWIDRDEYLLSTEFIFYIYSLSFFCIVACTTLIVKFRKVYMLHRHYTDRQFERYRSLAPSLRKYFGYLYMFWFVLECVNIYFSGGFPLLWMALGDARNYTDFGIPTFSGFSFTVRNFTFCLGLLLIISRNSNKSVKFMTFSLVFTAAILELSRGHAFFMLAHGMAFVFLYSRLTLGRLVKFSLIGILLMLLFGYIQLLRYSGGYNTLLEFATQNGIFGGVIITMLSPVILYLLIPFSNASLNFENSVFIDSGSGYSLSGLLPSFIRDSSALNPIELVNEAHNTVTFFTPLFMDFGYIGSGVLIFSVIVGTALIALKAISGNIYCILVYPIFFSSLLLSFFTNYFLSLTFFFFIFLAVLTAHRISRHQRRLRV